MEEKKNNNNNYDNNFNVMKYNDQKNCCDLTLQIEVFDDHGQILHNFMDEENLGSVCSLNAFHPTRNILVGGNSSGRLHVFMWTDKAQCVHSMPSSQPETS